VTVCSLFEGAVGMAEYGVGHTASTAHCWGDCAHFANDAREQGGFSLSGLRIRRKGRSHVQVQTG